MYRMGHDSKLLTAAITLVLTFTVGDKIASAQGLFVENDIDLLRTFSPAGGSFGWGVAELADIDVPPDGVLDFIITSPGTQQVFVYSGRTGALLFLLTPPAGTPANAFFGQSMADAGDTNQDGLNDIIVGSINAGSGNAYVYSGADGTLLHTFTGEAPGDQFGQGVGGAGDVNSDGFADVVIGAQNNNTMGTNSGRAYIYSGMTGALIRTLEAEGPGDLFGSGAAGVGDIDGDGVGDQIIGAQGGGSFGKAYVFSGATGALLFDTVADAGASSYGVFFVAGVGDVNADGTRDVYVGDFGADGGRGKAYVYSGVDGSVLHVFAGGPGEGVGTGRGAGDVNRDGAADLAIGHWTSSAGAAGAGRIVIYSGKSGLPIRTITSLTAGENTGFDVIGVGDVDGNGLVDFLVSAASQNRVYVIGEKVPIAGAIIAEHTGSTDPTFEGYTQTGSGIATAGPIANDGGVSAWQLSSTEVVRYQIGDLPAEYESAALAAGWKISLNARVVSAPDQRGLVTANLENIGGRRFDINLGLDANGDTFVRLNDNILAGPSGVGQTFTLIGSGSSYHLYELIYDSSTATADLFVDGVERLSNYPGHTNFVRPFGFYMGAYQGYIGNYNLARFEVLENTNSCLAINPPAPASFVAAKNRYLSFQSTNAGLQTAIRVIFKNLPPPHDHANGRTMWVGQPTLVSENSGTLNPALAPGSATFSAATLQCNPFFTDWSALGTVQVFHASIVTGATYDLQELLRGCDSADDANLSSPTPVKTSRWGDLVRTCEGGVCTPPDDSVDIVTDIVAILSKFSNKPGAPSKARADLGPTVPDRVVDILDVVSGLDAFSGKPFPFSGPSIGDPCVP